MPAPAWTLHPAGNVIPAQMLPPAGAVGGFADLTGVMRGRVVFRASQVGGTTAGAAGVRCLVSLTSIGQQYGDTGHIFDRTIAPAAAGATSQVSADLEGGYYYAVMLNPDPGYSVSISATTEELSWPS